MAEGRVPVIAGTGSNSTAEAIELTRHAKTAGADARAGRHALLQQADQEGLYQHYKAINDAVELPILIYNIPGRTGVDMSVATMARLAKLANIIGVKDATDDLARPLRTRLAIGPDFCMLSGEDATALAFYAQGGVGCISVTANVAPRACADMQEAWPRAIPRAPRASTTAWRRCMTRCSANRARRPVKFAASLLGKSTAEVRLPLVPASPEAQEKVRPPCAAPGVLNETDGAARDRACIVAQNRRARHDYPHRGHARGRHAARPAPR